MRIKCEKNFSNLPSDIQIKVNSANVFYSENYRELLKSKCSETFFLYSEVHLIMVIIWKKYLFKYAQFPSECINLTKNFTVETELEFLNMCFNYLKDSQKVQWMLPTPASSFFKTFPDYSIRIPFGNYVIDLTQSEDEIFSNFHSKHRNAVRKAEKSDVVVKYGGVELLNEYINLERETWERSGKSGNVVDFYKNNLNYLSDNSIIFIAYKDDIPQGGAIFYYNHEMSYYMFGASKTRPAPGSSNLLHWEALKFMKSNGVKGYSFVGCRINEDEGSKYHDIQRFKKRFGGELVEGFLFKAIFNRWYFRLFQFFVKIKSGNSNIDVIDQELYKWPDLQMNKE